LHLWCILPLRMTIKLGRSSRWVEGEVDIWIKAQIEGGNNV